MSIKWISGVAIIAVTIMTTGCWDNGGNPGGVKPTTGPGAIQLQANWKVECATPTGTGPCQSFVIPQWCWSGVLVNATSTEGSRQFSDRCGQAQNVMPMGTSVPAGPLFANNLTPGTWNVTYRDAAGNAAVCQANIPAGGSGIAYVHMNASGGGASCGAF